MSVQTIVLDTEVFIRLKNDFNHTHFKHLKSLPEYEVYQFAITDVTQREIETRIRKQIEESFQSLKKLQNNPLVSRSYELTSINNVNLETAYQKAFAEFKLFINEFDIKVILTSSVNVWDVLNLYFDSKPPFSIKKKSEFPDAVSLLAIYKEFNAHGCLVISGDSDWADFFDNLDNFEFFSSIPELMDTKLAKENSLIDSLKSQISNEIYDVKNIIIDNLIGSFIDLPNGVTFELERAQIEQIVVNDINIVELKKHLYGVKKEYAYSICRANFDVSVVLNTASINSYSPLDDVIYTHINVVLRYSLGELNGITILKGVDIEEVINN